MGELVRLERRDAVGLIRIDRPPVNALNSQVVRELDETISEIGATPDVRAAVVYGSDKTFSAGADLKEMGQGGGGTGALRRVGELSRIISRLEDLPVISIAAITGYALGGGCEISLACDFRFMEARAKIGQPEIIVGLIPGAGGTQRLPRLIGPARAKRLLYTGEFLDAQTAHEWGLADEVVEGDVLERALEVAATYAKGPTLSLGATKKAVNRGLDSSLAAGLELEVQAFAGLFATEDTRHGLESFAKEGPGKAQFKGR